MNNSKKTKYNINREILCKIDRKQLYKIKKQKIKKKNLKVKNYVLL